MSPTIVDKFWERVRNEAERSALRHKTAGEWRDITWGGYGDAVTQVEKGLLALGFSRGDKMSLLARNRPEWFFSDIACMSVGGTTVPIYSTSSPEQVGYVIGHSGSKVAVVEDREQLDKVLKVRSELPDLQRIVVMGSGHGNGDDDLVLTWPRLVSLGDSVAESTLREARSSVESSDVATFVYTSGTTGPPKAVMLTHSNIQWTCEAIERRLPIARADNARALSYLPLSHIAERMVSHFVQIHYGTQTWFAQSLQTLLEDLKECKPTYFFAVPRVWEKFFGGVQAKMAAADPNDRKTKLAKKAIELGRRVSEAEQEAVARGGKMADARIPLGVKLQHVLLDKLVLRKIRAAFGLEECDLPLSAGAPLNPDLIWFFHSVGLKIAEGYGQSEDNGPTSWNPPAAVKIGTVGTAFPGVAVKVADDGEILVRGGNVMAGYYKDEAATRDAIDEEGWLHSGDIGELDAQGYLKITDRKKDLIITTGGKNIAPQEIESRLVVHPLVSQVVVIGDGRPFLTALVTLDEEKSVPWAREQGVEGDATAIAGHERTLEEVRRAIDEVNQMLARVEGIKKFRILERDFLQEENEITPTLKVKRKQIAELYSEVVEEMYREDSPQAAPARAPLRK